MDFAATLQPLNLQFTSTGIPIPGHILKTFPPGQWRLQGTINGIPFNLAPRPLADGTKFLTVGGGLRKQLKIQIGDPVLVEFELVDADLLEIPEVLQFALETDEAAMAVWQQYTIGLQRSLVHYINAVKNTESKIKRALELTANMKSGKYPIAPKRK